MATQLLKYLASFRKDQAAESRHSISTGFPSLPKELRLMIWGHALERQRMLHIRVEAKPEIAKLRVTEHRARISFSVIPASQETFRAIVTGHGVITELLSVNREAREETLRFQRVHLPCTFVDANQNEMGSGTLHFNPEHDFIRLSSQWPFQDTFLNFIHHLKTKFDPRHIGLLNLAIDQGGLDGNFMFPSLLSNLNDEVKTSVKETLTQLHEVFLVNEPRVGRQLLSWKSGVGTTEVLYTRSFPINSAVSTFKRIKRDPRAIGDDLKKIYTSTGSVTRMLCEWQELLTKYGVTSSRAKCKLLLTFDPRLSHDPIVDCTDGAAFLQKEQDQWIAEGGEHAQNENLEKAVPSVFGFWLFPIEEMAGLESESFGALEMTNLSGHWPELGLVELP
ncbi:hypothetical protein EJ04DRAFT_565581 [Polyplosphaeria fusca]|uniref:2EXR domain-containing protein n=1 Tax=Polyplosphaeria fusca TaxID=682080 RepID=A0A9P4UY65_9PLEO|nr:hypothetical protein EJ04DRAFT_565581 [Polyplosphaeria fusca]